ncbi:hypothetical protein WMF45_12165 [Sorangium sp. So ce448]|uniref:hypothetical protein n=1 Tax=Sorangium sp. So ce448 TaxID=3133314 RepID=UPI003F619CFA
MGSDKNTPGTVLLSNDDLYYLLYRAAQESSSLDGFNNNVTSLLDQKLGSGAYILTLAVSQGGQNGVLYKKNPRLDSSSSWSGDTGSLPGSVSNYGVYCFVAWGSAPG